MAKKHYFTSSAKRLNTSNIVVCYNGTPFSLVTKKQAYFHLSGGVLLTVGSPPVLSTSMSSVE